MKKLLLFLIIAFLTVLSANATYVYENKNGEYSTDVDKFIPQSGVKVKTSKLADMMENGTRNAMEGNNGQSSMQSNQMQNNRRNNQTRKRTYKWF